MSPHQRTEKTQAFNGTCTDARKAVETFPKHGGFNELRQYLLAEISRMTPKHLKDSSQNIPRACCPVVGFTGLKIRNIRALTGAACGYAQNSTPKRRSATYGRAASNVQDACLRAMHEP